MAEEYPKIRGETQEEKNASIEHALRSIARRASKRAVVHIPPVPFVTYCDVVPPNGVIGRVVVPFGGLIKGL